MAKRSSGTLNDAQRKLLAALKEAETKGHTVTGEVLAAATGWADTTVKTYIGKKLIDRYLFRTEVEGQYAVRGVQAVADADFAIVMTQKGSLEDLDNYLTHLTMAEWEHACELLVKHGERRGYDATRVLERLLEQIR